MQKLPVKTPTLRERIARLERAASVDDGGEGNEEAENEFRRQLRELHERRQALREARKALPLEQRLALARQDFEARAARGDSTASEALYAWGRRLAVRTLEIEILERNGLVSDGELETLREDCRELLAPFAPLPVAIEVSPVPDETMHQIEREIEVRTARSTEMRDASGRPIALDAQLSDLRAVTRTWRKQQAAKQGTR